MKGVILAVAAAGFAASAAWTALVGQTAASKVAQALREQRMHLVDLRNNGYRIAFPGERNARFDYKDLQSDYLYSIIAPNGRSLYAIRRVFDLRGLAPPRDTLLKRSLEGPAENEEIVGSPLVNIFEFGVSADESFMIIAGRLKDDDAVGNQRDGIFVLKRGEGTVQYVAPYPPGGFNEGIRSLNVSDQGDVVVYEDRGIVTALRGNTRLRLTEHHAGKFPVLMPDAEAYIYADHGWLILRNRRATSELFRVPEIVGAIRVSPDGKYIAFGVKSGLPTQLRICELKTQACVDGPKYDEWIAGRETFWIKQ